MFDLHKSLLLENIVMRAKVISSYKFIKQAYNLDRSDINAGLCICFLYKPGVY